MRFGREIASSCLCAGLLFGLTTSGLTMAADEFAGYGINKYRGSSHGECDANNLTWSVGLATNIHDVFDDWVGDGDWDSAELWTNTAVDGRDFQDATKDSTCSCESGQTGCACTGKDQKDPYGCDHADVCFLSTHGSHSHASASKARVGFKMGDDSNDCKVNSKENMLWGGTSGGDLDILIIDACQSAQASVWEHTSTSTGYGFFRMINSSSTLSTFLGYHGNAPDRRAFIDEFAEDSDEDAIGLNWLTEAYQEDGDEDTCPVAVAFGDNRDDRHHMLDWGGFMDRENTGTRTSGATYYYIEGCNPDSGYEL